MSITNEITRLTILRNSLRAKLIEIGMLSDSYADLNDCVYAINEHLTPMTVAEINAAVQAGWGLAG